MSLPNGSTASPSLSSTPSQLLNECEANGRVPPVGELNDTLVTFRISEDWPAYNQLKNNEGNFVSLTHEELNNCGSVILEDQFNYREWHRGIHFGGFVKTGPELMDLKMGFLKLCPSTCKPYEFTGHNMQVVLTVINGSVTVRSTAYYEVGGVSYMFGFQLKPGDAFVVPANCAYTVENWNNSEEALLGYTTMIIADKPSHDQTPISSSLSSVPSVPSQS